MIEVSQFASEVMVVLSPYLVEAGKKAAGKAGEAAFAQTAKLWGAVKGKLASAGRGAELEKLENDPSPKRQAALEIALSDFLEANPQAVADLLPLLRDAKTASATVTQTLNSSGDNNINVQVNGSGNVIG